MQRASPALADAAKEAQRSACFREALREAAAQPQEVVVLFLEERGSFRWPAPSTDWAPAAPGPAPQVAVAGTKQQQRIVGAHTALPGPAHSLDHSIGGRTHLAPFSCHVDQQYTAARGISAVQATGSGHRHAEVCAVVAARLRLQPVWVSISAPWLNLLERLWRWLC